MKEQNRQNRLARVANLSSRRRERSDHGAGSQEGEYGTSTRDKKRWTVSADDGSSMYDVRRSQRCSVSDGRWGPRSCMMLMIYLPCVLPGHTYVKFNSLEVVQRMSVPLKDNEGSHGKKGCDGILEFSHIIISSGMDLPSAKSALSRSGGPSRCPGDTSATISRIRPYMKKFKRS